MNRLLIAMLAALAFGCTTLSDTRENVDRGQTLHTQLCNQALSFLVTENGRATVEPEVRLRIADACLVGGKTFLDAQRQLDVCEATEASGGICDQAKIAINVGFGAIDTLLAATAASGGF